MFPIAVVPVVWYHTGDNTASATTRAHASCWRGAGSKRSARDVGSGERADANATERAEVSRDLASVEIWRKGADRHTH